MFAHGFGVAALVAAGAIALASPAPAGEPVSFEKDVVPILRTHCLECHRPGGAGYEASGLSVVTYEDLMRGTRHGPIVVPGSAFTSNLNVLVEGRADPSIQMPFHREKLHPLLIDVLRRWVDEGAKNN